MKERNVPAGSASARSERLILHWLCSTIIDRGEDDQPVAKAPVKLGDVWAPATPLGGIHKGSSNKGLDVWAPATRALV